MKKRIEILNEIRQTKSFDVIVIGGGASGIGAALEASLRGYKTLLLEKHDFTKGTSSKSTKLVHGGVRYLSQGDLQMVREALKERGCLLKNAPHLVHNQAFIIPNYRWWEGPFYTIGLKFYDFLAGKFSMGRSVHYGKKKVQKLLPGIKSDSLKGGVMYHDGQFDDSRLAMDMLHALMANSGLAINYCGVTSLKKTAGGQVNGVFAKNFISGDTLELTSGAVINASGVWADDILRMDNPQHENSIRPSQGIHLVLSKDFLPGGHALMIPKTSDGRVLFAVPWHDHLVVGTTDTPVDENNTEPEALDKEIRFIIETASEYLTRPVRREDVLSLFAGLRPLAAPKKGETKTKEISRNHKVLVTESKLITVVGGKWTTYRKMGQDMIDKAVQLGLLEKSASNSRHFSLGTTDSDHGDQYDIYGNNAYEIRKLASSSADLSKPIHTELHYTWAEVEWVCINEWVEHLEDLLCRRIRAILLNAHATKEIAEKVSFRIAPLLDWDEKRIKKEVMDFTKIVDKYILTVH